MRRTVIILLVVVTLFAANTFANKISCNRENEEYACGSACQTTCSNLEKLCPIQNIKCNDACYCKDGYARHGDDNGPCIPIGECPKEKEPY